ncbi:MAG: histidine kinase [Clostridiales bacterium]|nr:histidine kinase [Clostridiales bacterium]
MKKRIFASVFFVSLLVAMCCIALVMSVLYGHYSQQQLNNRKEALAFLSPGTEMGGADFLAALPRGEMRLLLIGSEGEILHDSHGEDTLPSWPRESGENFETGSWVERTVFLSQNLSNGSVLWGVFRRYTWASLLLNMLQPLTILFGAVTFLSGMLAMWISEKIARPVDEIDLMHPDQVDAYEELTPLLHRLAAQNKEINGRMEELTRQQEEFTLITGAMQEGLIVIGSRGDILSCNGSALLLLGMEQAQPGESVFSLNGKEEFRETVEAALKGEPREITLHIRGRACALMASPAGEGGAILLLMDITEKEERDKFRREFTANVSHELKTPLTSISGYAEIIENGLAAQKDIPRFAGQIRKESARLMALVGDIIRLSRMEESAGTAPVPVELLPLIQEAKNALAHAAKEKQIDIRAEGADVSVPGDREMLYEMVLNLMDNAVKYNHSGGRVRAFVQEEKEGVVLRVADTGVGIPDAEKERVFERFYRVDKSRSRQVGGTGLGLSIVKHAALRHNARVFITDTPGGGTTVTVIFPH